MENEGAPQPQQQPAENKIIPFPTKIDQLPSEKIGRLEFPHNFDGGSFLMNVSDSSSGFSLKTAASLTRTSEDRPNPLTDEEKKKVASAMPGQLRFNYGNLAQEALAKYRKDPTEANKKAFDEAQKAYIDRAVVQIGILDPQIVGNEIRVKTMPRSFPVSSTLQDISNRKEILEFASTSATSGNIFSSDKKMFVSIRGDNATYPECGGAPASGYFDGELDEKASKESPTQRRRTLKPIDTKSAIGNVLKEMHEEMGLDPKDVAKTIMTGLAFVKKKTTHEFLFDIKMKLTAAQMIEQMAKERNLPPEEFAEEAVAIDATPEAIFTLCTKMVSPLAPGHYAAFAASGYRLMLERDGRKAADIYKQKLEVGIRENMNRIDTIVRQYIHENPQVLATPTARQLKKYEKMLADYVAIHPEATDEDKARHKEEHFKHQPKLDINGYQPQFLLTEQGLPDIQTALRQTGLIPDSKIIQFPQPQTQSPAQIQELAKAA